MVLIDIEMPENCEVCPLKQWDEYMSDHVCPFTGIVTLSIGRQDNCPLHTLPKKNRTEDTINFNTQVNKAVMSGDDPHTYITATLEVIAITLAVIADTLTEKRNE